MGQARGLRLGDAKDAVGRLALRDARQRRTGVPSSRLTADNGGAQTGAEDFVLVINRRRT